MRWIIQSWTYVLMFVLLSLANVAAQASVSIRDLVRATPPEPLESPCPTAIGIADVDCVAAIDDRWHGNEAFLGPFREEFRQGLVAYLEALGFVISSEQPQRWLQVSLDHFEGRKRFHTDGGDLRGSVTLRRGQEVIASKQLSESLNYRDAADQRLQFGEQFGVQVRFDTVLFFRLSHSFYRGIGSFLHEYCDALPLPKEAASGTQSGFLTIESSPSNTEVFLDGKLIGVTPIYELRLATGEHSLLLRKRGFKNWERVVLLVDGNKARLVAELEVLLP